MTEFNLTEMVDPDLLGFLSMNDGHHCLGLGPVVACGFISRTGVTTIKQLQHLLVEDWNGLHVTQTAKGMVDALEPQFVGKFPAQLGKLAIFGRFLQEFIHRNPNETFDPETWDHQAFRQSIGRNEALTAIAQELKKLSKERADERIMDIE